MQTKFPPPVRAVPRAVAKHRQPDELLAALLPPQRAPAVPLPPMLTRHQTLAVLGMGTSRFYQLIRAGEMPKAVLIGRSARWPVEEIASMRQSFICGETSDERCARVLALLAARKGDKA